MRPAECKAVFLYTRRYSVGIPSIIVDLRLDLKKEYNLEVRRPA